MNKEKTSKSFRLEEDSMGSLEVNNDFYYGAVTARALINFNIGEEKINKDIIKSIALIKKIAAQTNYQLKLITKEKSDLISYGADRIINEDFKTDFYDQFPISIYQTGSGTSSNMNVNEVISSIANEKYSGKKGGKIPIHPNDDVNKCQSSNDVFPTAMHITTIINTEKHLIPALKNLHNILEEKAKLWKDVIKIGRTHLQDATPLTVGNEWSGFASSILMSIKRINKSKEDLFFIAQGGTAVGTAINAAKDFDKYFANNLAKETKLPFKTSLNKFESNSTSDSLLEFSGSLNSLASSLMKIVNDLRFLSSGPRSGIGEIILPANEPGSSIMPGKVNPTQIEAISMVCAKIIGNHTSNTIACMSGQLQLNVFRPLIISNIVSSIKLLSDSISSFTKYCLQDIKLNKKRIDQLLNNSLMLITALNDKIGYDKGAKIAKYAHENDLSLQEATMKLGILSKEEFQNYVDPKKMI